MQTGFFVDDAAYSSIRKRFEAVSVMSRKSRDKGFDKDENL